MWMITTAEEEGSDNRIAMKAVDHFPQIFRQDSRAANRTKAIDWWIHEQTYLEGLEEYGNSFIFSSSRRI